MRDVRDVDVVTMSSKGQIVIPKPLREHLGIEQGTRLMVEAIDGRLELRKMERDRDRHRDRDRGEDSFRRVYGRLNLEQLIAEAREGLRGSRATSLLELEREVRGEVRARAGR